tara:strand:- start:343 stop:636 length:294 start_codon:yes stop_codon:yes gene_type:complete
MKYIVLALAVFGCGEGLSDKDFGRECQIHDDGYSHTVMFCGGREVDNVEDVFIACDVRVPREDQFDGCVGGLDLMDLTPDCELQHVCMTPWTEDDQQ